MISAASVKLTSFLHAKMAPILFEKEIAIRKLIARREMSLLGMVVRFNSGIVQRQDYCDSSYIVTPQRCENVSTI